MALVRAQLLWEMQRKAGAARDKGEAKGGSKVWRGKNYSNFPNERERLNTDPSHINESGAENREGGGIFGI